MVIYPSLSLLYSVVLLCLVHPLVIDVFSYASLAVTLHHSPGHLCTSLTVFTQCYVAALGGLLSPLSLPYSAVLLCLMHPLVIDVLSYASLRVIRISPLQGHLMHSLRNSPHTVVCDWPSSGLLSPLPPPHSVVLLV